MDAIPCSKSFLWIRNTEIMPNFLTFILADDPKVTISLQDIFTLTLGLGCTGKKLYYIPGEIALNTQR